MSTLLTILLDLGALLFIATWIYRKQAGDVKRMYWPALGFKLLAGAAVGWTYFYYYGQGDTITYWQDGNQVAGKIISDPLGALRFLWNENSLETIDGLISNRPRSLFFVKIAGILSLFCGGNYWMMSLMVSFVAFLGAWYLYVKTIQLFPSSRLAAALSFLFYPSVVFWSSGLIKESLGLASLYFLSGVLLTIVHGGKVRTWEWSISIVSVWAGWYLKYYWLGIFIPIVLTTTGVVVMKRSRSGLSRFELIVWPCLFLVILMLGTSVHPNFYPNRFLEVIYQSNQEFMLLTDSKNAVHYYNLAPSFPSMVMNAPLALMAGLFRPFAWEAHSLISLLAGLENLILLILALTALPSLRRVFQTSDRILLLSFLVYILLLATFLALATPNLGTLSRYKVGFLPFFVFILLQGGWPRTWLERKATWGRH